MRLLRKMYICCSFRSYKTACRPAIPIRHYSQSWFDFPERGRRLCQLRCEVGYYIAWPTGFLVTGPDGLGGDPAPGFIGLGPGGLFRRSFICAADGLRGRPC